MAGEVSIEKYIRVGGERRVNNCRAKGDVSLSDLYTLVLALLAFVSLNLPDHPNPLPPEAEATLPTGDPLSSGGVGNPAFSP